MKVNNIFKGLMLLTIGGLSLVSCEDEPEKYETTSGTPTVNYIRPVDYDSRDSLITSASLDQTICIVGDNLRSIVELYFNDQKAVLNTSYMTDHTVIVTVPGDLPETVSDKMYMITTGKDTISYDFGVTIPAPVISSLSNEYAAAGESVTINGDYFLDYDNYPLEIKFGDYTLSRDYIQSISKTAIVFTMPDDLPSEKPTITSKYGSDTAPFMYKDTRGMLFDFDTACYTGEVLGSWGWHSATIQSDDTSLSGNYLLLGNNTMDDATWNDSNFAFEYWCGNWRDPEDYSDHPRLCDVADFSDWENKSLKFEMCVPASNPWSAAPLQVIFSGADKVSNGNAGAVDIYGTTLAGCNNTFFHAEDGWGRALYMPWYSSSTGVSSFSTEDKWVTVTIPISDFNMDYDGNKAQNTFGSVADFASLTLFVITGSYNEKTAIPEGVECTPIIKIDNIRVVPNN